MHTYHSNSLLQDASSANGESLSVPHQINFLHYTPISKQKQEFKSPAPSSKKVALFNKSPMITTQARLATTQFTGQPSSEKWAVSPVCSRLRDHIIMLNGNSNKERLFLQSPMTNQFQQWQMTSPAIETAKIGNFASTAPNTSANSKHSHQTPNEYSDVKTFNLVLESPSLVKVAHVDSRATSTLKSNAAFADQHLLEPSSNSNWQSFRQLMQHPSHIQNQVYQEQMLHMPRLDLTKEVHTQSLEHSHQSPYAPNASYHPVPKCCDAQPQYQSSIPISVPLQPICVPMQSTLVYYHNDEEEDMDNENSQNMSQQENMDQEGYERIVRKRKRKSSDQIKILMREFDRNPNWTKETLLDVSRKTGLSEAQVYKWGWDQKKKKFGPDAELAVPYGQTAYEYHQSTTEPEVVNSQFSSYTPFPSANLLDQLSHKLAQEETQHKKHLDQSSLFDSAAKSGTPETAMDSSAKSRKGLRHLDLSKGKKISTFAVESATKQQENSCEKVKSTKKNLMEVSGFDSIDKKRVLKGRNKENVKIGKLILTEVADSRKTRSGKESVGKLPLKETTDMRKLREQRALKKLSLVR